MDDLLPLFIVFVFASLIGNCAGDQQTLIDCAEKGKAKMMAGGQIKCEIVKENHE